jgi:hypothetical protein
MEITLNEENKKKKMINGSDLEDFVTKTHFM